MTQQDSETPDVHDLTTTAQLQDFCRAIGRDIRKGELKLGRPHYALSLLQSCAQAHHCGYDSLVAIELGVAGGAGLLDMCTAAEHLGRVFGQTIEVIGFDNATGLPAPKDFRDHPEMWQQTMFKMPDPDILRSKLPEFARLIVGDVEDTIPTYLATKSADKKLGFVSIDVDYYSSTVSAFPLFEMPPEHYLPAMPVYLDDMNTCIVYNSRCGEPLALSEFNARDPMRLIEEKPTWAIRNFRALHVLDHPFRQGAALPKFPLQITQY